MFKLGTLHHFSITLPPRSSPPGGYSATHPVIQIFWEVVEGFTDEEKRKLLKFVTSCSRPPLLGFKVRVLQVLNCFPLMAGFPSSAAGAVPS